MKLTDIDVDSQLYKFSSQILARQSLQFPIQLRKMTVHKCKEYHLKKLYELSLKSIGKNPRLDGPNDEQKEWTERRMKAPEWTWQRWFVDLYFADEQKLEIRLTDKDIVGEGMV